MPNYVCVLYLDLQILTECMCGCLCLRLAQLVNLMESLLMKKRRILLATSLLVSLFCSVVFSAQTYHLSKSQQWQDVSDDNNSSYLLTVSKLKENIVSGNVEEAKKAISQLVEKHPELSGKDLDSFMEADYLYSKGELSKAVKKYKAFTKKYPESWLYEAALERQFDIATAFLSGAKRKILKIIKLSAYDDGAEMMQRIAIETGNEVLAKRALQRLAESYEDRDLYLDAYNTWLQISTLWPTAKTGEDALLGMARSMYLGYKGPKYQAASLKSAKGYYASYARIYPEKAKELKIADIEVQIREQMAYKQYYIASYYDRTGAYVAASSYCQYVIDKWPGTIASELATRKIEEIKEKVRLKEMQRPPRKGLWRFFDLFDLKNYLTS